jgi:phage gpG-like protein
MIMVDFDLSGSLPALKEEDFQVFAQDCVREMDIMVRENFAMGGRPEVWKPLRTGQPSHLYDSGFLYEHISDNVRTEGGFTIASVGVPPMEVPYAAIDQFGGIIHHPGSKRPVPIATPEGVIFRWMKEPHDIEIPSRPYLVWIDETIEWIRQNMGRVFVNILTVNQEPL